MLVKCINQSVSTGELAHKGCVVNGMIDYIFYAKFNLLFVVFSTPQRKPRMNSQNYGAGRASGSTTNPTRNSMGAAPPPPANP